MQKIINEGDYVFYKAQQSFCKVLEVDKKQATARVTYTHNPFTNPHTVTETLDLGDLAKFDEPTPKKQSRKSAKTTKIQLKVNKKLQTEAQALKVLALLDA